MNKKETIHYLKILFNAIDTGLAKSVNGGKIYTITTDEIIEKILDI